MIERREISALAWPRWLLAVMSTRLSGQRDYVRATSESHLLLRAPPLQAPELHQLV
jgi:hypothetical protein